MAWYSMVLHTYGQLEEIVQIQEGQGEVCPRQGIPCRTAPKKKNLSADHSKQGLAAKGPTLAISGCSVSGNFSRSLSGQGIN
eukprot:1138139-Pelagomonas_calceolata.AAC.1